MIVWLVIVSTGMYKEWRIAVLYWCSSALDEPSANVQFIKDPHSRDAGSYKAELFLEYAACFDAKYAGKWAQFGKIWKSVQYHGNTRHDACNIFGPLHASES